MFLVINMKNKEARIKLEKARQLLLEVVVIATENEMANFASSIEEIGDNIYEWERLLE